MKLALLLGVALAPITAVHPALAAAPAVVAAPAGETLYGRVSDASGSGLPGAEVVVRETGRRAVTDASGQFSLIGLEPGAVTLEVRYLGLPNATTSVNVVAGTPAAVDVVLGEAEFGETTTVEDVVVVGAITDGVARALNQQRNADATVNVVSADAIGRYPDPNVAESLQRVPGIGIERDQGEGRYINIRGAPSSFTAITVDGVSVPAVNPDTRAVDLDTLPSDIVSNLEVSKTLLPSQDADSIAGAVNIKTRSAFDSRGLRVAGSAGYSYNDFGGHDERAQATVSNTFADRTFGALLSLSYSKTEREPDNVENGWVVLDDGHFGLEETLFKDYQTKRTRTAVTGALEWRPNDATRAYLRGSFAQFEDDEYRNLTQILWSEGALQPGATDSSATFANTRLERQFRHRTQRNDISTIVAGAEHDFSNFQLDYDLAWSKSEQTYPHRDELRYRSTLRPTLSYSFDDPQQPTYSLFTTNEHQNEATWGFRENTFRSNATVQEKWAGAVNVRIPARLAGADATWAFGAKYSSDDISADEQRYRDRAGGSAPTGVYADYLSDEQAQNFDYRLGRRFDPGAVMAYFDSHRATSPARIPDIYVADYQAQEDILAGYGQVTLDYGSTRVIAGVRVENTSFDGSAPTYDLDTDTLGSADVSFDDTQFFPGVTVRHDFSDNLVGRFALTRAINRPEFNQIVPRATTEEDGATLDVELGNPDLKPALSNNLDAGLEYYFSGLGVASVSVFYKDLEDYRYILTTSGTYQGLPANLTRPENAPDGKIQGVELNWSQKLSFLPGWLSGFGFTANYTWTDAEIELGRTYAGRNTFSLPGQSDRNYNLSAFYETDRFNARLSYTNRSDYLNEINADDGDFDLYWKGREQLDFTAGYEVTPQIEVFTEAKNLTNSPGVRYYGSRERVYEYEEFGYNVFVGVRFKL